jgi:purine-nucleoside phosphorylase
MGIRCLGISVVTNMAAGIAEGKLGHEEVLEVGARTEPRLTALLRELVPLVAEL